MNAVAQQTTGSRHQKRLVALLSVVGCLFAAATATGCAATIDAPGTEDIVNDIPWGDAVSVPEALTYTLEEDGEEIGTTTLTVERDGLPGDSSSERLLLTQRSEDGDGNSDTAEVLVDAGTLEPVMSTRTIVDEEQRKVAVSTYETAPEGDCDDSGQVVRIEQQTFDPPDEEQPETRAGPLCVPENAYENDSSLFIWRTIKFEEGYTVTYNTVIATRRDTQAVTLHVRDRVDEHPAGESDAWLVEISADGQNQRAWFSTDDAHVLLAYQNESFLFVLKE